MRRAWKKGDVSVFSFEKTETSPFFVILIAALVLFLWVSIAYAMDWKKLHEEADKTALSQAYAGLQQDPSSPEGYYLLGLVCLNLHDDAEAYRSFRVILAAQPQDTAAKWGMAEVLRRRHELQKSQELVEQVIEADPEFSPAYITLAYIKYIQMDFNRAVKLAQKVLEHGQDKVDLSNYVRAYLMYAGAKGMIAHYGGPLSKIFNGTAVMPNLKKAQKLQPDSAGVLFGLGSFYLLAPALAGGDLNEAEAYLTKAVAADQLFADAYVRLAQLYRLKGDDNKYDFYLSRALTIDPKNELALDIKSGSCKFICVGN